MAMTDNYQLLMTKLDAFIRKFYVNQIIRGALLCTGLVVGSFLLVSLLESQFYFHPWQRKVLFYGFMGGSLWALFKWLIEPIMHYFKLGETITHENAALIIGQHFTNVKDRLLNILQLQKQSYNAIDAALIDASINQKSEEIRLVPFKAAIDLKSNRKFLQYALPPLFLFGSIMLWDSSLIKDSTYRLINNNKEFVKPAPFNFVIKNPELKVPQNEDYVLSVTTTGKIIPNELYLSLDGHEYRMKKEDKNQFSYLFINCQRPMDFKLSSGEVSSIGYKLEVLAKPNIQQFQVKLDYPAYTGRQDEEINNVGDLVIPVGTIVKWSITTKHTDKLYFSFGQKGVIADADRKGQDDYYLSRKVMGDISYKVAISNQLLPKAEFIQYSISTIPDAYPVISVQTFADSLDRRLMYFVGNASDDYGIRSISFNYQIKREKSADTAVKSIKIPNQSGLNSGYNYNWDLRNIELKPGDEIIYFFEVFDNDGVNGSKAAKTSAMVYKMPTVEEMEKITDENSDQIKKDLEKSLKDSQKVKEDLKKIREKLLQQKELDWQAKKDLEKLLERQKEIEKQVQEAKQKFEENMKNQEEYAKPDENTKEKQEQLSEMFDKVISEEMKELMQQIQELMQQLEKEQTLQMMDQMKLDNQKSEQTMDRLLELYKSLEVEKKIDDAINKLDELSKKQEDLGKQTEESKKSQEDLKKEQEDLNKKFEDLQKELKDIEKKNKELDQPKDFDKQEQKSNEVEKDMQDAKQEMESKENKKASKKQKKAAAGMKEMSDSMKSKMESGEKEQNEEDLDAMRQLLENLVTLSFDQEEMMKQYQKVDVNTPKYVDLGQKQKRIKEDFVMVKDSLLELSKRVSQIETFIVDKVAEVDFNLEKSLENIQERQKPQAQDFQQRSMKNMNDLALMLSEAMDAMQQQMAGQMSGNQKCSKPGGKSSSKSGDRKPMDKIGKGQKGASEQMQKMSQGQKQGGGQPSSKDFAQMAAQQAALRKALQDVQKGKKEQGQGSKLLEDIIKDMNEMEKDLVNKKLTNETLKRQQEILTKLLEADRAEREREYDNKRKAEKANQIEQKVPPALQEYIKKKQAEAEQYKTISPALRPYYKNLVEDYFKNLKN